MNVQTFSKPRPKLSLPYRATGTGAAIGRTPSGASLLTPGDLRRIVSDMIG